MLPVTPQSQARRAPLIAPGPDGCRGKDLIPEGQPTSGRGFRPILLHRAHAIYLGRNLGAGDRKWSFA